MSVEVTIIIVSYNSARHIRECLRSVSDGRRTVSQNIIVVDNMSADETTALVSNSFPGVKLILSNRNLGFGAGANLGAAHSDSEFLLFLNPDTLILDHAVDVIVDFARRNPGHGLYGGRSFRPNGQLEPSSCWGLPTLWSLMMFATGLSTIGRGNRVLDPESLGKWKRDTVREVGIVTGCFLLVRHSVWNKLGGFDARYFLYGEDMDLAKRCIIAGYHPIICPDAKIIHEVGQSSETSNDKLLRLYKGKVTYFRTFYKGPMLRIALSFLLIGISLRSILARIRFPLAAKTRSNDWRYLWSVRKTWIQGYEGNH